MSWIRLAAGIVTGLLAAVTLGQAPTIPAPDKDPFVGTWKENRDLSNPRPSERAGTYTRVIAREGDEIVLSSTLGPPERRSQQYRMRCDGSLHPAAYGLLSCSYTAPNTIDGETKLPNGKTKFWRREVSADGQRMTLLTYKESNRSMLTSTTILERVK
jgi:hypothetical protein